MATTIVGGFDTRNKKQMQAIGEKVFRPMTPEEKAAMNIVSSEKTEQVTGAQPQIFTESIVDSAKKVFSKKKK